MQAAIRREKCDPVQEFLIAEARLDIFRFLVPAVISGMLGLLWGAEIVPLLVFSPQNVYVWVNPAFEFYWVLAVGVAAAMALLCLLSVKEYRRLTKI